MKKISSQEFLDLRHLSETRWQLAIAERHSGTRRSLFGGVGLAAAISVLEDAADAPVVWATAQYISRTEPSAVMDLDIRLPAVGRSAVQGQVTGHIGDRQVISVMAALGSRPGRLRRVSERIPEAPKPEECELVRYDRVSWETIHDHCELRMARGMFGFSGAGTATHDHRSLVWVRLTDVKQDSRTIAILADYMPAAIGNWIGKPVNIVSLDNTVRYADPIAEIDTDWILCDNRIDFIGNGFANGTALMWSQNGSLLATASQSMILS